MANTIKNTIKSRRVAIIAADGFNGAAVETVKEALEKEGAQVKIVSKYLGTIKSAEGNEVEVDKTFLTGPSVTFDAVFIPGGKKSIAALKMVGDAVHFVNEAFKHCKPIAATGEGLDLLAAADLNGVGLAGQGPTGDALSAQGIVTARNGADMTQFVQMFTEAIAQHRFWLRKQKDLVPA